MMAFMAVIVGLGLLFYIVLGFRYLQINGLKGLGFRVVGLGCRV